jgi:CheY-like chemotaxis protein
MTLEHLGGFTVESCGSGEEALESVTGFSPDLVLLDVMMPGLDGPATLSEIRKILEFVITPVVFMTAKTQKHEIKSFFNFGDYRCGDQPFDPPTLPDQIKDIWNRVTDAFPSGNTEGRS